MPTLCIIHEAISQDSAIAKAAMVDVRTALAGGWDVSVVAQTLDPSLRDRVNWLRLYVPPRGFLLKWTTARHFIRKALGNRTFDVVHAHQPQVCDLSDVFSCHFLTRVAYERNCLEERPGLRPRLIRLQQQGVLYAEDRCYRRWNPATHMLFGSDLTRREFARLYGMPPSQEVLLLAFPPLHFPASDEPRRAREALVGNEFKGLVVGYLGGLQERKGYKRLLPAIAEDPGLFLLMGGQFSEGFAAPALRGRMRALGLVTDVATFYAACDVLVVPSVFEPFGMVAFEAASRGVPVIATDEVGALPHLLEYGNGARWTPGQSLGPIARQLIADRETVREGTQRMAEDYCERRQGQRLLEVYEQVLRCKRERQSLFVGRALPAK